MEKMLNAIRVQNDDLIIRTYAKAKSNRSKEAKIVKNALMMVLRERHGSKAEEMIK